MSMSQSIPKHSSTYIISVLLIQQTLGALAFPISKYGLDFIEPFTFAFFRFLLASVSLLIIVYFRKYNRKIDKRDYLKIIGLGVLIIPINQTLFLWGQSMTAAGHGSLLFATVPIWILVAALIHLKERPGIRRVVGIIIAMGGVITVMASGALELGKEYLFGDFIILIAVIAWAYYTIFGKKLVQKYGAIRITAYALASGSMFYFPFGLYAALKFDYSQPPLEAWWAVVYMAIGTSLIAYVLWYWVLKYMDASRIAVFHNLQPFIAVSVAYVWLGEPLGAAFIVGAVVAIIGVIIAEV